MTPASVDELIAALERCSRPGAGGAWVALVLDVDVYRDTLAALERLKALEANRPPNYLNRPPNTLDVRRDWLASPTGDRQCYVMCTCDDYPVWPDPACKMHNRPKPSTA